MPHTTALALALLVVGGSVPLVVLGCAAPTTPPQARTSSVVSSPPPPPPAADETSCRLAAIVDESKRQLNTLSGVVAQRRMRAKAVPTFECVDSAEMAAALVDGHDAFVFDLDGVLWSGSLGLLPGVRLPALIPRLRVSHRPVFSAVPAAKA